MNKKHILQHLICFLISYLIFAFVHWDVNPINWSKDQRVLMIFTNAAFQYALITYRFLNKNT